MTTHAAARRSGTHSPTAYLHPLPFGHAQRRVRASSPFPRTIERRRADDMKMTTHSGKHVKTLIKVDKLQGLMLYLRKAKTDT